MTGEPFDAIVVGSGAAGGFAAKELCERGLRTLLLEAGPAIDVTKDFPPPAEGGASKIRLLSRAKAVLGGQAVQARCMSFSPLTRRFFVNDRENPYVATRGAPFNWYRGRQVGGRLHLWGRNALRLSDHELKAASFDGFGHDWPLSYADLAPWYEKVETFLGVAGTRAGIPNIPDGVYERPHTLTNAERRVLADLAAKWPGRPATTARIVKHNPRRVPLPVLAAQATGRLALRSNAVVSHVTVDPADGRARGVVVIDRESGRESEEPGRVVVLCASTIETLRILLNSKSPRHPRGIGNHSGRLGHYITDHVMVFEAGPHEPLEPSTKADPYDFGEQTGIYVPSFRNTADGPREKDFLRGYSLLGSVGRIEPGWFFMAIGEMLPRYENFVELDARGKDAWGIPVARIHCAHGDNEKAMVRDMHASLAALARDCGLKTSHLAREGLVSRLVYRMASSLVYTKEGALVPGSAVHETGGAAMGDDPETSVLDPLNRCWEAQNVFVTDCAAFPTAPFQNPGLTIMALSARAGQTAARHLARKI